MDAKALQMKHCAFNPEWFLDAHERQWIQGVYDFMIAYVCYCIEQFCGAYSKVHSRDGMAHDFFGSVRLGARVFIFNETVKHRRCFDRTNLDIVGIFRHEFSSYVWFQILSGKACGWHKRGICEYVAQIEHMFVLKCSALAVHGAHLRRVDEWMRKREDPGRNSQFDTADTAVAQWFLRSW